MFLLNIGLGRIVLSIIYCESINPGLIPGLVKKKNGIIFVVLNKTLVATRTNTKYKLLYSLSSIFVCKYLRHTIFHTILIEYFLIEIPTVT